MKKGITKIKKEGFFLKNINDIILNKKDNLQNWVNNIVFESFESIRKQDIEDLDKKIYMIQDLRNFQIMNDDILIPLQINLQKAIEFLKDENIKSYDFKVFTDSKEPAYILEPVTICVPREEINQRRNPKLRNIRKIYLSKEEIEEIEFEKMK